jgi:predicted Zn-dependent protease with MMP-like domain
MSSFSNPHYLYLFSLKNGKKRLAYGQSPADALEILAYRLTPQEMDEMIRDDFVKINQRKLQEYVDQLG